ncbi:unnamed protein product [Closterium sp. Naga37s-1]|nr:unnamed protein product [Closterium sp. Naga37s-1]
MVGVSVDYFYSAPPTACHCICAMAIFPLSTLPPSPLSPPLSLPGVNGARAVVFVLVAGGRGGALRDVECRPQGRALPAGQAAAGRGVGGELPVEPRQGRALPAGQAAAMPAGGWRESYLSSQDKKYVNLPGDRPHLVSAAWAMLALMEADQHLRDPRPLHAAARVLVNGQMEDGDFPQEVRERAGARVLVNGQMEKGIPPGGERSLWVQRVRSEGREVGRALRIPAQVLVNGQMEKAGVPQDVRESCGV